MHESFKYTLFAERHHSADIGEYNTYGIQPKDERICKILHDISTSKEFAQHMVDVFNKRGLSPYHFKDAVEDMLP